MPTAGNAGNPNQGNGLPQDPEMSIPVYLSGKVAVAGGEPLPEGVTILRSCGSSTRAVAYTDRKGNFSFQWGDSVGIMPDASDSDGGLVPSRGMNPQTRTPVSRMSNTPDMAMCELTVELPGYRASAVSLVGHRGFDNPDLGTIVLHRMENVEGLSVSATAFRAPAVARKAYDKGLQWLHKGKAAEAGREFEKAVGLYPQYANAWLELGKVRVSTMAADPARDAFAKALEADPKLVEAHAQLGLIQAGKGEWAEATRSLDTALRLDPVDFPRLWFVDAVANFNLKNFDAAEKSVRQALKMDPKHENPQADRLLGVILVVKKDYAGAVASLKTYLQLSPESADAAQVRLQVAEMEHLPQ